VVSTLSGSLRAAEDAKVVLGRELETASNTIADLDKHRNDMTARLQEISTEVNRVRARNADLATQLTDSTRTVAQSQKQVGATDGKNTRLTRDNQRLREEVDVIQKSDDERKCENYALKQENSNLQAEIGRMKGSAKRFRAELSRTKAIIGDSQEQHAAENAALRSTIETLTASVQAAETIILEMTEATIPKGQALDLASKLRLVQREAADSDAERKRMKSQINELRQQLQARDEAAEATKRTLEGRGGQIAELTERARGLEAEFARLKADLARESGDRESEKREADAITKTLRTENGQLKERSRCGSLEVR
jgi:chromosome segregation ATPase